MKIIKSLKIILLLILICFGAGKTFAQDLFEQAVSGEFDTSLTQGVRQLISPFEFAGINFEINGYLRGDLWVGKKPDKNTAEVQTGYAEGSLKLRARKNELLDAFIETRLWIGYENEEEHVKLDLREAYINAYTNLIDLRFGQQIIVWGTADVINPTNTLTPIDMRIRSPEEDDTRKGNLGLRTWLNLDPFRFEIVSMPVFEESHYPLFELPSNVFIGPADYPDTNLEDGIWAIKLHYDTAAIDASVSYADGYATFPGIEFRALEIDSNGIPLVTVGYRAYRHQVLGFDFETAIGKFELHGEAAYRRTKNYNQYAYIPSPDVWCILGLEHEFTNQITVIAQYIGHYVIDFNEENPEEIPDPVRNEIIEVNRMIFGQTKQVQHGASIRFIWKLLQDTLTSNTFIMANFSTMEYMIRQEIEYDITDTVSVIVGGELFTGPDGTFFNAIHDTQSSVFGEIKFSF